LNFFSGPVSRRIFLDHLRFATFEHHLAFTEFHPLFFNFVCHQLYCRRFRQHFSNNWVEKFIILSKRLKPTIVNTTTKIYYSILSRLRHTMRVFWMKIPRPEIIFSFILIKKRFGYVSKWPSKFIVVDATSRGVIFQPPNDDFFISHVTQPHNQF